MIETIGWIGSLLLAFCGLPEALYCFYRKSCRVPWTLIIPWYLGEILCLLYTYAKLGMNPLIINYFLNIVFISVMIYYKKER